MTITLAGAAITVAAILVAAGTMARLARWLGLACPRSPWRASIMSSASAAKAEAAAPLSRAFLQRDLWCALVVVGLGNGIAARAITAIGEVGWADAIYSTFDVSIIVWAACAVLLGRVWALTEAPVRRVDLAVACACTGAFLLPLGQASWVGLTLLSVHMTVSSPRGSDGRRAAALLLALTLAMLWARLLLSVFSGPLLRTDAALVAALLSVQAMDNTVPLADGSGVLWIAPACSSVLNLALTLLCAQTFLARSGRPWTLRAVLWTLVAGALVFALNIARLAVLAAFPRFYDVLHGPAGQGMFGLLTLAVIVGVLVLGGVGGEARRGPRPLQPVRDEGATP